METEAFTIDTTGKMVALVDGDEIKVRLVRIPNSAVIVDCLRPRYLMAE